jgi:cysteine synthase/rhodanese-related sulfurtransferase
VVALVSRKLQEGVLDELGRSGVRMIDLDIDICPAPGLKIDQNLLVAKGTASNVREQLRQLGFDAAAFDNSRAEVEDLLAKQNVIDLAKLLAKIYDGFCPAQYENEMNVKAHETVTAPEIDQQLQERGFTLGDMQVVTAFGTGGTSAGLDNYIRRNYGKKGVRVVFPLANQDVAGIRTKGKAAGLKFYDPSRYAGQHEVDFGVAKRLMKFFVSKGYDIGESGALALLACVQLLNFGVGQKYVVIIADGLSKYARNTMAEQEPSQLHDEVTLEKATSRASEYERVIWTHAMFTPKEEGIELIASSLGTSADRIKVAKTRDVQTMLATQKIPEELRDILPKNGGRVLVVCMVGGTSVQVAKLLAKNSMRAESLIGGIANLSASKGKQLPELLQVVRA